MKKLTRIGLFPILFSSVLNIPFFNVAQAIEFQNLAEIKSVAEQLLLNQIATQFQNQKVNIILGNLDPHLKLPKCTVPLNIQPDIDLSKVNNTLLVSCQGEISWGVRLSYKVQRYAQVITPSKTIAKGEKINEND